jgi:hypothetical protein
MEVKLTYRKSEAPEFLSLGQQPSSLFLPYLCLREIERDRFPTALTKLN